MTEERGIRRGASLGAERLTDEAGSVVAVIELDPWGGETDRSVNQRQQPYRYTSYERDGDGVDQALMRSYHGWWTRFNEPDPWEGSYDLTDPQSFNRYAYVRNDPVNFVDPDGLQEQFINTPGTEEVIRIHTAIPRTTRPLRLPAPQVGGVAGSMTGQIWWLGRGWKLDYYDPIGGGGGSGIGGQDVGDLADLSSNIRIIGTGDSELERHKSEVLKRLEYMARNQSCNDAFRRASLPTPFELITNGRIALAARPLLTNPANNSLLGISEDVRAKANKSNAPAQTIRPQFTLTGKAIIVFAADAFSGDYLDEAVPHEMIHAAGVGSYPSFGYGFTRLIGVGNDLGRYPHYRDIMTNCMLK